MKRILGWMVLVGCLVCFSSAAFANSWGLKSGELYKAVSAVHTWDNYTTIGDQCGNFAIMGSRYHNALFFADAAGKLTVCHTAVWQPKDAVKQSLKKTDNGIVLAAGKEQYTFELYNNRYTLTAAKLDGVTVTMTPVDAERSETVEYRFEDGSRRACYNRGTPLLLEDFNIRLFPRSVDEVLSVNWMRASLASGECCLEYPDAWQTVSKAGKGTAAVYSAPFGDAAWRAAKGKAAVGLKGTFQTLRGYTDAEGQGWTCVMYEVSERTSRIGWIQNKLLGNAACGNPPDEVAVKMLQVKVNTTRETFLTDDPFVSQFEQFTVPQGTQFVCMGLLGNDWAYVAAEVNSKGRFTDGGDVIWGFVPLRDLALVTDETERCQDVMQQLEGAWHLTAGGSMAEERLNLHAGGTYEGTTEVYGEETGEVELRLLHSGAWYVTKYNNAQNKYWYDAQYEITFIRDNGITNVKGLVLDENGFSLVNNEGGGGYERIEGEIN